MRRLGLIAALCMMMAACGSSATSTDGGSSDGARNPATADAGAGAGCGPNACPAGKTCCNRVLGLCADPGGVCAQ
jgi:hypothetical protein